MNERPSQRSLSALLERHDHTTARRTIVILLALWALSFGVWWAHVTMNVRDQPVNVRFVPGIADTDRLRLETSLHLIDGERLDGDTWKYRLGDVSRGNVEAVVREPLIADTFHLDRNNLRVTLDRPDVYRWVRVLVEILPLGTLGILLPLVAAATTLFARPTIQPVLSQLKARYDVGEAECWACVGAAVILAAALLVFVGNGTLADERVHFPTIDNFLKGDATLAEGLTTIPGFHATVAAIAWATNSARLQSIRLIVFAISVCAMVAIFLLAHAYRSGSPALKTLQFVFLPIVFPQLFLIYTDILSLLFVVLMMLGVTRKRYWMAGAFGVLSCLVRQNNVVWVALAGAQAYLADNGWRWVPLARSIPRYVPFALSGVVLAGLLIVNQGEVAMADVSAHPLGTIHVGNVVFMLFVVGVVFLPIWWAHRSTTATRLHQPLTWVSLVLALVVCWFYFEVDHPYNRELGFLRNTVLMWSVSSDWARLAFLIPVCITVASLGSTRLKEHGWLLYPTAVFSLLPFWLIEQRYYLVPVTLWLAERSVTNSRAEWVQVLLSAAASLVFFRWFSQGVLML